MDQAKHDDIKQLLELSGALGRARQFVDLMLPTLIEQFRQINPKIPEAVWESLTSEAEQEFRSTLPELEEPVIVIYDANFSAEEIKHLLAFYDSPIGRKMVAQAPRILEQSVALGKVWGERVGQRIADRIRASAKQKGYEL